MAYVFLLVAIASAISLLLGIACCLFAAALYGVDRLQPSRPSVKLRTVMARWHVY
jgi:hypothetical protein